MNKIFCALQIAILDVFAERSEDSLISGLLEIFRPLFRFFGDFVEILHVNLHVFFSVWEVFK
jgi:hypothetical protein